VTTGFGLLSDQLIDPSQIEALQKNLIRSHSVGVGPYFNEVTTRAIMLLRANVIAMGYSGVRMEVLKHLVDMINKGVHPSFQNRDLSAQVEILLPSPSYLCADR